MDNTGKPAYLRVLCCNACRSSGQAKTEVPGKPEVRLTYVLSGTMEALTSDGYQTVSAGEMHILPPGQPWGCRLPETPTAFAWVRFDGAAAEDILSEAGLTDGVYRVNCPSEMKDRFRDLRSAMRQSTGAFHQVALLLDLLNTAGRAATSPVPDGLDEARKYMEENFRKLLSVADCAAKADMSEGYFAHQFRAVTGLAPGAYLAALRVRCAKEMLADTPLSVAEIAAQCGYPDPLYFSRQFKQATGMSPTQWRGQ